MWESGRKEMAESRRSQEKAAVENVEVGGEIAVGEHDALGFAGGAGGVDDGGEIVGLDVVGAAVEGGIASWGFFRGHEIAEPDGLGDLRDAVHEDDFFDAGFDRGWRRLSRTGELSRR